MQTISLKARPTALLVSCALFVATCSVAASELSGTSSFEFRNLMWSFQFNVTARIDPSGTVQLLIEDLKKSNDQAWASMAIQAKITKITRNYNDRIVHVTVTFQGMDNHFKEELATGKITWGPVTGTVTRRTWTGSITVRTHGEQLPENLEPGPPADYSSTQAPQSQPPDSDDPCDPASRSTPPTREGLPTPHVNFAQGHVSIKMVGCDQWTRLRTDMALKPGDIVQTSAGGRATLVLGGGSFVRVRPDTNVIIPRENPPEMISFLRLASGVLWAHARKEENALRCATPHCVVGVRGTEFELSDGDGKGCVKALEHDVSFADAEGTHSIVVPEGTMSCVTDPGTGPSPPEPIPGGADESVPPLGLAGAWSSNFGTMTLQQNGVEVTGTYEHDGGRIEAILSDHVLAGTWMEAPSYKPDHDSGAFQLVFAPDGQSFTGHWRYGFSGDTWDGDWSGTRRK